MFYNFVPVIMFSAFKLGVSCVRDLVSPQGLLTPLDLQNERLREASARAHFMQCRVL